MKRDLYSVRSYGRKTRVNPHVHTQNVSNLLFPAHKGKTFDELYPYVGCFFADKDSRFISKALKEYSLLSYPYDKWYGDQVALRQASQKIPIQEIDESLIAGDPTDPEAQHSALCLHFKGAYQKSLMEEVYKSHFPIAKTNTNRSFRSNPNKAGYEIPTTLNPYFFESLIGSAHTR